MKILSQQKQCLVYGKRSQLMLHVTFFTSVWLHPLRMEHTLISLDLESFASGILAERISCTRLWYWLKSIFYHFVVNKNVCHSYLFEWLWWTSNHSRWWNSTANSLLKLFLHEMCNITVFSHLCHLDVRSLHLTTVIGKYIQWWFSSEVSHVFT